MIEIQQAAEPLAAPHSAVLIRRFRRSHEQYIPQAWRSQAVDATARPKTSEGFIHPRLCRGRPFSSQATALRSALLRLARSSPLGRYWRSNPFVFSLLPRCHGLCGSQKNTLTLVSMEN